VVVLVASAGGHHAIRTILESLPVGVSVPLLVMQHLAEDSTTVALYRRGLPFTVAWVDANAVLARGQLLVCRPQAFVELPPAI